MSICVGVTKKGEACKAYAMKGMTCCYVHMEQETRETPELPADAISEICQGVTKKNEPCKCYSMKGKLYCYNHRASEENKVASETITKNPKRVDAGKRSALINAIRKELLENAMLEW